MKTVADIATMAFVVGAIMVLVRPGSQGPAFAKSIGQSFATVLVAATGGGGTIPSSAYA
jgi:hypothetical protein